MRIYIIEDDLSVIGILEDIIEREGLGRLCGATEDGAANVDQIMALDPDLVLVDLLMPEKDGIQLVRELKERGSRARFIMISQVAAKEMVAKAYQAGIEFFVHKPINLVEIRQVVGNVGRLVDSERTLSAIQTMLQSGQTAAVPSPQKEEVYRQRLQYALSQLGMAGEKGSKDIMDLCMMLLERRETVSQVGVGTLCARLSDSPKSTEQRVRRAVERGLHHIASLGVEDYGSEQFTRYASRLFPFSEVRAEMAHIQGKGPRGKASLKKFLDGLLILAEEL